MVQVDRNIYVSVYGDNNYYESDRLSFMAESAREARLVLGAFMSVTHNDYPSTSPIYSRSDRSYVVQGWIGYRFKNSLEVQVFARHRTRTAADPSLEYDLTRFGTTLRYGF